MLFEEKEILNNVAPRRRMLLMESGRSAQSREVVHGRPNMDNERKVSMCAVQYRINHELYDHIPANGTSDNDHESKRGMVVRTRGSDGCIYVCCRPSFETVTFL